MKNPNRLNRNKSERNPVNLGISAICLEALKAGIVVASGMAMKKIEALIPLSKLNEVQDALEGIGIDGMTACEVRGFSRQNKHKETYRSKEYTVGFLPMVRIDLVVAEQILEQAVKVIGQAAKTGAAGAGKILISEVNEAVYALAI